MTEPGHETGQIGTCGDGPQAVVLQPVRRLPEWRRMFSSASHWMLKDGKHIIAEVEAVIGNASKPAAYRIDEHDAEIAPNLRAGMLACERYYGLVGEDCACGRRITGTGSS